MNEHPTNADRPLSEQEITDFLPPTLTASLLAVGGLVGSYGGTTQEILGGVSLSVVSIVYLYKKLSRS